jgi:hypothetical protein
VIAPLESVTSTSYRYLPDIVSVTEELIVRVINPEAGVLTTALNGKLPVDVYVRRACAWAVKPVRSAASTPFASVTTTLAEKLVP